MLVVITSPSGGGKTTLVRALLESDPDLAYSISTTTRPPREGEVEGKDYNFISRNEFRRLIKRGVFLEWAEVYGNLYGTRRDRIEQLLSSGRDVVADLDVQGAMSVRRQMPDAVLIFLLPPSMEALEERLRCRGKDPERVIARRLSAAREEIRAVAWFDYVVVNDELEKALGEIRSIIAAERCKTTRRVLEPVGVAGSEGAPAGLGEFARSIVFASRAMEEILERAARVAKTDSPVLLLGESGTGKEVLAEAIHRASRRADGPLVKVNCGAIPPSLLESELFGHEAGAFTGAVGETLGLFRAADGGTIFLDEVGELPLALQVKLLRVLQDGEVRPVGGTEPFHVDVRMIAATNKDLAEEVKQGRFRDDLFYRLNVVPLRIPPLRERREDIPLLVEHFLRRVAERGRPLKSVAPEAMEVLMGYDWPGNVRQLENAVEHAVVLGRGDRIEVRDLPQAIRGGKSVRPIEAAPAEAETTLREIEMAALRRALEASGGNLTRAARALGITRRALTYRIEKYGIEVQRRRGRPRRS